VSPIACVDVAYATQGRARAACVVIDAWENEHPCACYATDVEATEPYASGAFYRRELPCLLAVLRLLAAPPAVVVIDGYVHLPPDARLGLGAHLYDALAQRSAVVGIAKSAFAGAADCSTVVPVLRGRSKNPVYVSAAGIRLPEAAAAVRSMAGSHRIPAIVRVVDRLTREPAFSSRG
jgi:deoxyribonuclease V